MSERILSLGAMYFEQNSLDFPLPDTPQLDTEIVGGEYVVNPGGSAINFSRVCASLGLSPVFVGKRGDDGFGEALETMMAKEGIVPAVIRSSHVQTNTAINYIRGDGKSIMYVSGTANQSLEPAEVESKIAENLPSVKYLYLGGGFKLTKLLPVYVEVISKARQEGVSVVIDHGRVNPQITDSEKEIMKNAIAEADFYLPSKGEFLDLWQADSVESAVESVREFSNAIIVVKDAENGAYGFEGNNPFHSPAFQVQVTNTVGAGDSFNAGFIKAQVDGLSFGESLRFACATAALKISKRELPTLDEVKKLCQMS